MRFLNDRDCPDKDCIPAHHFQCPNIIRGCQYWNSPIPLPTENQVGDKLAQELFEKYGDRKIGCYPEKCPHNPNRFSCESIDRL